MGQVFLSMYNWLDSTVFTISGFSFTLLDVLYTGLILSLIGFVVGKIYLFVLDRR